MRFLFLVSFKKSFGTEVQFVDFLLLLFFLFLFIFILVCAALQADILVRQVGVLFWHTCQIGEVLVEKIGQVCFEEGSLDLTVSLDYLLADLASSGDGERTDDFGEFFFVLIADLVFWINYVHLTFILTKIKVPIKIRSEIFDAPTSQICFEVLVDVLQKLRFQCSNFLWCILGIILKCPRSGNELICTFHQNKPICLYVVIWRLNLHFLSWA